MGVGLGLGVTLSVLSPQSTVQATPQKVNVFHTIRVVQVTINNGLTYRVGDQKKPSELQAIGESELGSGKSVLLSGSGSTLFTELSALKLGTTITAVGNNNGTYTYTVTEIVTISRGQAQKLVSDLQENLIITAHQYPWDTTQVAVIASYRTK